LTFHSFGVNGRFRAPPMLINERESNCVCEAEKKADEIG